jgi:acetolactate synthase I/II/III large subunit
MLTYEFLAHAFVKEGVAAQFVLLGDGNMHWVDAMQRSSGMQTFHARHEHCACGMAMGYYSATGKVGVASVTCGPGFTQIMTALSTAARAHVPLIVFAGEAPLSARWHIQRIEQYPFAVACGAHYISAHSPDRMDQYVREAFYIAKRYLKPVVLGVPYDLQQTKMPLVKVYCPSDKLFANIDPIIPSQRHVTELAELLRNAKYPMIIAGRGVMIANAAKDVESLAEQCGATIGTTLLARGLFDHNPFSLGVIGGHARDIARKVSKLTDLAVFFGCSMSYHTLDGGKLFPGAKKVQVDIRRAELHHGTASAVFHFRGDAKLTASAVSSALSRGERNCAKVRTNELVKSIEEWPADSTLYEVSEGTVDPRELFKELETIIPKDFDVVSGSGHHSYFHTVMRGYDPYKYHAMRDFGAIGNAISYAIGVAAVRRNGRVVLFEGDGSLLMHIQELETVKRHKLKLLIVCCNDGAYGAELHKLRKDGLDESSAMFGRSDFESIATGFGIKGTTITSTEALGSSFRRYLEHDHAEIWNVHISDKVLGPKMRRDLGEKSA